MTPGRKSTNVYLFRQRVIVYPQIPYSVLQECKKSFKIFQQTQCETQINKNSKGEDSSSKYDNSKKM